MKKETISEVNSISQYMNDFLNNTTKFRIRSEKNGETVETEIQNYNVGAKQIILKVLSGEFVPTNSVSERFDVENEQANFTFHCYPRRVYKNLAIFHQPESLDFLELRDNKRYEAKIRVPIEMRNRSDMSMKGPECTVSALPINVSASGMLIEVKNGLDFVKEGDHYSVKYTADGEPMYQVAEVCHIKKLKNSETYICGIHFDKQISTSFIHRAFLRRV